MADKRKFNLKLEKYLLNELSPEEMDKIENNPVENEYVDYLKKDNEDFFNKFDIKKLAKDAEIKSLEKTNIIKFPIKTITTLAAAACLILTINILPKLGHNNVEEEIIFLKGSQTLNIYLKSDNDIKQLDNLDKVNERDQLQITYKSKDKYGIIFSVDGLNNITYHYPEHFNNSTSMDIGKEISLPTSYILDNAPYFEKFYMVTSKNSFDLNLVNNKVTDIKVVDGAIVEDLILPSDYSVYTVTLLKE